jgi:glycosyltransferase involved in cell wall biosynthesis
MQQVSVIIPVYNGLSFIRKAVESVWQQTFQPSEIILVDDGSEDGSINVMNQLAEESLVPCKLFQQSNKGPASSRNLAVKHASGTIIAFLDQDDLWHPTYLEKQIHNLQKADSNSYVICNFQFFVDLNYQQQNEGVPAWVRPELMAAPQPGYLPSCMVMHRELFLRVGYFDESLIVGYDFDWIVKAIDAGIKTNLTPEVLLDRRIHSDNQSSNVSSFRKDITRIIHTTLSRRRIAAQNPT